MASWLHGRERDVSSLIIHQWRPPTDMVLETDEINPSTLVILQGFDSRVGVLQRIRNDMLIAVRWGFGSSTKAVWEDAVRYYAGHVTTTCDLPRATCTPRIKFDFGCLPSIDDYDWNNKMRHLFGYDARSAAFRSSCEYIRQNFPDDTAHLPSIPIEFVFRLSSPFDPLEYVQAITILVRRTLEQTRRAEMMHPDRPRFKLEAIELSLTHNFLTQGIVEQLQVLMALDVKITRFSPPMKVEIQGIEIEGWRHAWSSLLFTICGHPQAKSKAAHPVEAISLVESIECPPELMEAYFSVVVHTKTLKKVELCSVRWLMTTTTQSRWLLYTFFSNASTTSVEHVGHLEGPLL